MLLAIALINRAEIQNNLFSQLTEKNLERMRNQSKFGQIGSEKDMEKVARDFESVFVNKLFESMRKGVPKSGLLDSEFLMKEYYKQSIHNACISSWRSECRRV